MSDLVVATENGFMIIPEVDVKRATRRVHDRRFALLRDYLVEQAKLTVGNVVSIDAARLRSPSMRRAILNAAISSRTTGQPTEAEHASRKLCVVTMTKDDPTVVLSVEGGQ
jgi:hypothetical protein